MIFNLIHERTNARNVPTSSKSQCLCCFAKIFSSSHVISLVNNINQSKTDISKTALEIALKQLL